MNWTNKPEKNQKTDNLTRRQFIGKSAAIAAGAALGPALSTAHLWAAPVGIKKTEMKLRQDLVPDGVMDQLVLSVLNGKSKNLSVKSSYINRDLLGWGYERDHCLETPSWYSEGESCDLFIGRGPALAQLADDGLIAPLDEFIDASEHLTRDDYHKSIYGSILNAAVYRDKLWGIPIIATPYALFCNMDLFEAGGVKKLPVTWEDAIDAANRITRDTNGDGEPDVFGYSQCSFQFPLEIASTGIPFVDLKNKRVLFDGEAGYEALDTYRRLRANSPPHVNFERGDMGMKISVSTNAFGRYAALNHQITRLPEFHRRANTYGDSDGIVAFAISAKIDKDRQEAAWQAIELLAHEKLYYKFEPMFRNVPLRYSILNSDKYQSFLEKNPQMIPFKDELAYCIPKPCIPEFRLIDVVMREILYPVQQPGDPRLIPDDDLRKHLKEQSERVNEVLAKATW